MWFNITNICQIDIHRRDCYIVVPVFTNTDYCEWLDVNFVMSNTDVETHTISITFMRLSFWSVLNTEIIFHIQYHYVPLLRQTFLHKYDPDPR